MPQKRWFNPPGSPRIRRGVNFLRSGTYRICRLDTVLFSRGCLVHPQSEYQGVTLMSEASKEAPRSAPEPVPVDETSIAATYANFCRVTGTPEELIVDFGLNKQVVGNAPDTIQLNQRIIVNFFTAKRLAGALMMAVQRHEQAFGVLETDVQKRVVAPPKKA